MEIGTLKGVIMLNRVTGRSFKEGQEDRNVAQLAECLPTMHKDLVGSPASHKT